jgi:small subunit ribosomal protein S18
MAKAKARRKNNKAARVEAPKPCRFTKEDLFEIDYRDVATLSRYVSANGKIQPRAKNNISAYYQRQLTVAVKRARFLGLLPTVGG